METPGTEGNGIVLLCGRCSAEILRLGPVPEEGYGRVAFGVCPGFLDCRLVTAEPGSRS